MKMDGELLLAATYLGAGQVLPPSLCFFKGTLPRIYMGGKGVSSLSNLL